MTGFFPLKESSLKSISYIFTLNCFRVRGVCALCTHRKGQKLDIKICDESEVRGCKQLKLVLIYWIIVEGISERTTIAIKALPRKFYLVSIYACNQLEKHICSCKNTTASLPMNWSKLFAEFSRSANILQVITRFKNIGSSLSLRIICA